MASSLSLLVPLALAACGPVEPSAPEPVGEARQAITEPNGRSLNGRSLNGRSLNGQSLNGRSLNGVSLAGVAFPLGAAGSLALDGTAFHRTTSPGHSLSKKDLVGALFTGTLDDQSSLLIRIDGVTRSHGDDDIRLYAASFAADGGWFPLCTDEADTPSPAIPLAGRWSYAEGVPGGGDFIDDPSSFTFACVGHALAKCVELGYAPWESVDLKVGPQQHQTASLASYHQACTRLIRADYCGDGSAHTVDGTLINLYDRIGVQKDTEGWPFEAEWSPDGARCMTRVRELGGALPTCWNDLQSPGCGTPAHAAGGALLVNEVAPSP